MKSRLLVFALVAMLALLACSQLVAAQEKPHFQIRVVPQSSEASRPAKTNPPPANGLYGLEQAFVAVAPIGSDGGDSWPCFGGGSGADCSTIAAGGVVVGIPSYVFSYATCDANAPQSTYIPCGQTETWYEDDSNDALATDDLTYSIVVTQGANIIADSGIVDFGPNPYGGFSPPADIIIYGDQNFGTLGMTGKNNGNCSANYNYPSPVLPGVFVVAANKTCVNPVPGLATLSATTSIATATFTTKAGVTTVKYTTKYKTLQKWNIWLQ